MNITAAGNLFADRKNNVEDDDKDAFYRAEMARLREGSWVDIYSHGEWLRAKLTWASGNGALFMFVSHGGQPHTMTRRSCAH